MRCSWWTRSRRHTRAPELRPHETKLHRRSARRRRSAPRRATQCRTLRGQPTGGPRDRRTFRLDSLRCPNCPRRLRVIATITDPPVVRRILEHLSERSERVPADPIEIAPARAPTWLQAELGFEPHDGDDFVAALRRRRRLSSTRALDATLGLGAALDVAPPIVFCSRAAWATQVPSETASAGGAEQVGPRRRGTPAINENRRQDPPDVSQPTLRARRTSRTQEVE